MWDLRPPLYHVYLVHSLDIRGQSGVHAEHSAVHYLRKEKGRITAEIPRQSKTSVQYFHGFELPYFLMISS